MRSFWRGFTLATVMAFVVSASCHPFPCRTGVVGQSVFMVCR